MRRARLTALAARAPAGGPSRHFRAARTAEVGPLVAGVGVAAVIYGVKLLLNAASNPTFQETMRRKPADGEAAAASASAARPEAASAAAPSAAAWGDSPASAESYYTTDVMGIDLGHGAKEWSGAVAAIVEGGEARVVENEQGGRTTPSLVAFADGGELLVGQPAKKLLFSRTATPVAGLQQLLGLAHGSAECARLAGGEPPFELVAADDGSAAVQVHGVRHAPADLTSHLLTQLKAAAEDALGGRAVLSAVMGAPVPRCEPAREALALAAKRAGLQRLVLVDEPLLSAAAAEAELPQLSSTSTLGVYDLAGRAFTFSVLQRGGEGGEGGERAWAVCAASRLPSVGSERLDDAVIDWLATGFLEEHGIDLRADHLALHRLHEAAEAAKLELCVAHSAAVSLPFITADASGPKHLEVTLSRARFDDLAAPTLDQTLPACEEALAAAGLTTRGLDAVLLVGGAARAPAVVDAAAAFFGAPVLRTARPEEAVALGAAAHASELQALAYGTA